MNRLASENSPYLLQHKHNPVDWYPWGSEALGRARKEDKPIFLSIGYAACHWCHVMERESFEDDATAEILNRHFVSIKVDREERLDLDRIYMDAVVALTGQGGWPMSVFLTPEGEPFFGGTYFPPEHRFGMPSFQDLLHHIIELWEQRREDVIQAGKQLSERLRASNEFPQSAGEISQESLDAVVETLVDSYDGTFGGWGQAPKFPQPMALDFLLMQANLGSKRALPTAEHALRSMAKGGMHDLVGGGFARYSVDNEWRVPHFEKMLYDNAQLARVYLHAYLETKDAYFRRICERTLDFIARELRHELGGFYSSMDADSEGEEGKFYLWDLAEIEEVLSDAHERARLLSNLEIVEGGNFEGRHILRWKDDNPTNSVDWDALEPLLEKLYERRSGRVWPAIDDKVLVSWNALALIAFAEAARYLERSDYLKVARTNAQFLLDSLLQDGRLMRSWRQGKAMHNAYLEDHAALILGLLSLFQSDSDEKWFRAAVDLRADMETHFADSQGGYFDTRADQPDLLLRPKELQDNATPSGNALAATALLHLSAFTGEYEWHEKALKVIQSMSKVIFAHPMAFGQWLCAASFAVVPNREIAILGERGRPDTQALLGVLWEEHRPFSVAAVSDSALAAIPLLADRTLIEGKATGYVCRALVCKRPVTSPAEFARLLSER